MRHIGPLISEHESGPLMEQKLLHSLGRSTLFPFPVTTITTLFYLTSLQLTLATKSARPPGGGYYGSAPAVVLAAVVWYWRHLPYTGIRSHSYSRESGNLPGKRTEIRGRRNGFPLSRE